MKDFLDKISSYNIFNYLLPGAVFSIIIEKYLLFPISTMSIFFDVFIYYFIGLMISRFGSIVIEPLLKKINFVKFSKYEDFIQASKVDPKIELLLETNNMYRTFIAMMSLIFMAKAVLFLIAKCFIAKYLVFDMLLLLVLVVFLFSYKKQTGLILGRIKFYNFDKNNKPN